MINNMQESKRGYLNSLLRSKQTVFSFKELMLLWGGIDSATARARAHYYTANGQLYPLRRGLYAKDKDYDRFELATRIFTPSYISFETVLQSHGIIFQHDTRIFAATYQSREISCDTRIYVFKTLKNPILLNSAGIENRQFYFIASAERAFLDIIYLHKQYHFDNVSSLNWDRVFALLPIYGSHKRMERSVGDWHKKIK